jgi:hypothetical protein
MIASGLYLHLDGDPVAGDDAQTGQRVGETAGQIERLPIADAPPFGGFDHRPVGRRHAAADQVEEMIGHDGFRLPDD